MATADSNKTADKNKPQENAPVDPILAQRAPSDFINVGSANASLYRPEDCKLAPVQGWLVEAKEIESTGAMPDFTQIVIELTKPSYVLTDGRESAVREAKPGELVVLTVTTAIAVAAVAARHPTKQIELYMRPVGKVAMKGRPGQSIWRWDGPYLSQKTRDKVLTAFRLPEGFDPRQLEATGN